MTVMQLVLPFVYSTRYSLLYPAMYHDVIESIGGVAILQTANRKAAGYVGDPPRQPVSMAQFIPCSRCHRHSPLAGSRSLASFDALGSFTCAIRLIQTPCGPGSVTI
jgi:hypothetical protein